MHSKFYNSESSPNLSQLIHFKATNICYIYICQLIFIKLIHTIYAFRYMYGILIKVLHIRCLNKNINSSLTNRCATVELNLQHR